MTQFGTVINPCPPTLHQLEQSSEFIVEGWSLARVSLLRRSKGSCLGWMEERLLSTSPLTKRAMKAVWMLKRELERR